MLVHIFFAQRKSGCGSDSIRFDTKGLQVTDHIHRSQEYRLKGPNIYVLEGTSDDSQSDEEPYAVIDSVVGSVDGGGFIFATKNTAIVRALAMAFKFGVRYAYTKIRHDITEGERRIRSCRYEMTHR